MKQLLVELKRGTELSVQVADILECWNLGQFKQVLLHIYSGREEAEYTADVAKSLSDLIPEADILGTMSAGEIMDGHVIKKGVLIGATFFESTDVQVLRFDNVKGNEADVGKRIREKLDSIPDIKAAEIVFPGTEFETKSLFDEIDSCLREIVIFGGYSGGHAMNAPSHYVFDKSGIAYDSVMVTTFAGRDFHVDADKVIGWEPLGLSYKVTKADGQSRALGRRRLFCRASAYVR